MSDHWLKQPHGKPTAVIRTQSNGVQRIYNPNGVFLGEYRPHSDTTHLPNGSLVGRGNWLTTLI